MQLTHSNTPFQKKKFPVTLVCDAITGPANIGGLFRIAEAFGIGDIIFCGRRPPEFSPRMRKTARTADKHVSYTHCKNSAEIITTLKDEGYTIISLEITGGSIPIHRFDFTSSAKIALVLGNENLGVSQNMIEGSDHCVHIEMFGRNSSMNVVQATGIAIYEITRQMER